ncbi:MAG: sugar ABC transporter substrate-binding protein [Acidimicrobiales bacterium]
MATPFRAFPFRASSSRSIRLAVGLVSLGLVASACGGGSSPGSNSTTTTKAAPGSTPSGSSSTAAPSGSTSHKGATLVYFIFNGYTPPFFAPMAQGIKDVQKHYPNLDIKILSANGSASTEISQIHEAVAAGAKGIILNPVDESVTTAAKQAMTSGIPVVTLDRDVSDPSARIAFIGDNDVQLGRQEAEACLKQLAAHQVATPWHVVDLQGTQGASTSVDREKGFEQVLQPVEKLGKVKVVLNQSANFDTATAQRIISEFVAKTHNIQLVLASNDAMALGAITALKSAGLTPGSKTYVCGADAQPESLAAIKAGTQLVTVTHSPYVEAFWSVEAMSNYLTNKTKPPAAKYQGGDVRIPQVVVTKSNVASISAWGTPQTVAPLPYGKAQAYPSSSS